MSRIIITIGEISLPAELYETETAAAVEALLPLRGAVSLWGEEIYFDIPLRIEPDSGAREDMEAGELGYWPEGPAFCIFFGRTPASTSEKPRAYSPVNVIGRILEDPAVLKSVRPGDTISISKQ